MFEKRIVLFFYAFLLNVFFTFSQNKDAIYEKWQNITDTISSIDTNIKVNREYLQKVSLEKKIYILNNSAFKFEEKKQIDSAFYYANKAIAFKKDFPNSPAVAEGYIARATILMRTYKIEEAKEPMRNAKIILNKNKDHIVWHIYYQQMGSLNNYIQSYEKGIKYSDSAIQFLLKHKDTIKTANLYHNLGINYYNQNKLEKAVESLLSAIKIKEKYKTNDLASSCYILAVFYNNNRMFTNANKYIEKSINAAKKQKHEEIIMRNYMILAKQFTVRKMSNEALFYNDSSMVFAKKLNMNAVITELLNNKGDVYFNLLGDKEKGIQLYTKAYENSKEEKMPYYIHLENIEKLIGAEFSVKNYRIIKEYLNEFGELIKDKNDLDNEQVWHKESARYYNETKNYKKAVYHYTKSYAIYDSISGIKIKEKVAELEKKYETKNKELEIAKLNEEKALQNKEILEAKLNQRILLFSVIGVSAFFFLGFGFYNKLKKQKQNLALVNEELSELNTVKNRLFSVISHDLKGMIIPFQRSGKIMKHYVSKGDLEKTTQISQEIENNSERLSNTLDNLLNWSVQEMNGYSYELDNMSIKTELTEIIENFNYHTKLKNIEMILEIHEDETILFDKGGFHVIFRNLISNAIKFTENGIIKITSKRDFNKLCFYISDSGTGMSTEELEKLFSLNHKTSVGTKGEKGTGLGLNLVYKFVKMYDGNINVSSKLRLGTEFEISFPVKYINKEFINSSKNLTA